MFNVFMAVIAGLFVGRRSQHVCLNSKQVHDLTKKICIFTTVVITGFGVVSAIIALSDPYTAANLEQMFHITSFQITRSMLYFIIVVSDSILAILEYWLTKKALLLAYGYRR